MGIGILHYSVISLEKIKLKGYRYFLLHLDDTAPDAEIQEIEAELAQMADVTLMSLKFFNLEQFREKQSKKKKKDLSHQCFYERAKHKDYWPRERAKKDEREKEKKKK